MARTIVTISGRNGRFSACLDKAAQALPDMGEPHSLGYGPAGLPPLDSAAHVEQYGSTLVAGLKQHPAIRQVLEQIFAAGPQQSHTLYFGIKAPDGQQIRWESLRDEGGRFVALDGRCHIGRIAEEATTPEPGVRLFAPPLRVLAFLSGTGLDATEEWSSLASAVDRAVGRGLPVRADVHIGQPALLQQAQDECGAGARPGIAVHPMPADGLELEQEITDTRPHILHFFCHGKAEMGAAYLQLATQRDHAIAAPQGSISVPVDDLARLAELRSAWLVVLNCCEGAHAGGQLDSMAYRMVSEAGLAAAIGMLEPVDVGEASRFCGVLYPELFSALEAVLRLNPGAAPITVDLSPAMSRPRRALRDMAGPAQANGRWTLPVLYLQEQPLQVFRPIAAVAMDETAVARVKATTIAGMLANLPPDTPVEARDRMLGVLDDPPRVPTSMRPDRWGAFGEGAGGGG